MAVFLIILSFLFCVFTAVYPVKIKNFPLDMTSCPVIVVILLFLSGIINHETIKSGILGNGGGLRPWEILIIFFSTAYVSISVDVTGIFDYLSYRIVYKVKGDGLKLFLFFYLFACGLTSFTSNDIVILTLTPIIFYLGLHSDINVIPLLFAEFFGANTLSMLLYIGNPTNIIIGNAIGLGFFEFSQIMWLPALIATIANFFLLYFVFFKELTRKYNLNNNSKYNIRHWGGAILSSALMLLMLILLIFSEKLEIPIWKITLIFAGIFIIEDIGFGIFFAIKEKRLIKSRLIEDKSEIYSIYGIPESKHEFLIAIDRVPWKILPFICACFILVQGLNQYHIIDWLARYMGAFSQTPAKAVLSGGTTGLILANLINNQPMTILLGSVMINKFFQVTPAAFRGYAYSVIIASNLGANLTLLGALAGLMWERILFSKGIKVTYAEFFKKGILITPLVFALTLFALYFVIS